MKPDLSVIIPVFKEQAVIHTALDNLYHQEFEGRFEVIVVDGSKACSTINLIENPNVIKLSSSPGRGTQMNIGARIASGETLLFLHCDTVLPQKAFKSIQALMEQPSILAGAFDLSIRARGVFFRMIEKTASLRSRITRIPYGDQAIFIKRSCFFEIGQYRDIPIMEDVDLMKRMKKAGKKIEFLNQQTSTSPRRWQQEGMVYCTLRNWLLITLFFLGMNPVKLACFYKQHTDR